MKESKASGGSGSKSDSEVAAATTTTTTTPQGPGGMEINKPLQRVLSSEERSGSNASTPEVAEVVYKKGIYLPPNSLLKDLRNGFVDSRQLDSDNCLFCFLRSDAQGDYVAIDDEEELLLEELEAVSPNQRRTLYIEALDKGGMLNSKS